MFSSHSVIFDVDVPRLIKIPRDLCERLLFVKGEFESVWMIFGKSIRDEIYVEELVLLKKSVTSRFFFRIDPIEWMENILDRQKKGLSYVGIAHLHLSKTIKPSPLDIRFMMECPGEVWLIVSIPLRKITAWTWSEGDLINIKVRCV